MNNIHQEKEKKVRDYESETFLIGVDSQGNIHMSNNVLQPSGEAVFEILKTKNGKFVYNIEQLLAFRTDKEEARFWNNCVCALVKNIYVNQYGCSDFEKVLSMHPIEYIQQFKSSEQICFIVNRMLNAISNCNTPKKNLYPYSMFAIANQYLGIVQEREFDSIKDLINDIFPCILVMFVSTNVDVDNLSIGN